MHRTRSERRRYRQLAIEHALNVGWINYSPWSDGERNAEHVEWMKSWYPKHADHLSARSWSHEEKSRAREKRAANDTQEQLREAG